MANKWRIPLARLSFLFRATYDTLPSACNLHIWYGSEETYQLCNSLKPKHEAHPPWLQGSTVRRQRHRVLHKLAQILETCRLETNRDTSYILVVGADIPQSCTKKQRS